MKAFLVLVVALGVPLSAVAQGRLGDSPGPSAAAPNGGGGCRMPPIIPLDNPVFDAPPDTTNRRTDQSPGTQAWLEKEVELIGQGTENYAQMDIDLERGSRENFPVVSRLVKCAGNLKSIKFLHVSRQGLDDYEVEFDNGALEWGVGPLGADQKISRDVVRFFYPEPTTKQFEDFLKSLQQGRPNYADLASDLASRFQGQWPTLQKQVKDWGGPETLYYVRQGDDGSYIFIVGFRKRRVIWQVGPLDANGKFTSLSYTEGPG